MDEGLCARLMLLMDLSGAGIFALDQCIQFVPIAIELHSYSFGKRLSCLGAGLDFQAAAGA